MKLLPRGFSAAQMPYGEIVFENVPHTLIERSIDFTNTFRTVFMYS